MHIQTVQSQQKSLGLGQLFSMETLEWLVLKEMPKYKAQVELEL